MIELKEMEILYLLALVKLKDIEELIYLKMEPG